MGSDDTSILLKGLENLGKTIVGKNQDQDFKLVSIGVAGDLLGFPLFGWGKCVGANTN